MRDIRWKVYEMQAFNIKIKFIQFWLLIQISKLDLGKEPHGETVETVTDFIFWAPTSPQMVIAAMKLKDTYSLKGKL